MKQENCCTFQILVLHKAQLFNQRSILLFEHTHFQAVSTCRMRTESCQSRCIQILNSYIGYRYCVPALASLAQKKAV